MKNLNKKYFLWFMFVHLLLSGHVDAQELLNRSDYVHLVQKGDWAYYPHNDEKSYLYPTVWSCQELEETFKSMINAPQIAMGAIAGVFLCSIVRQYYINLEERDPYVDVKKDKSLLLSFDQRFECIEKSLQEEVLYFDISLVACLTQNFSRTKLEKFIKILKKFATEYTIDFMHQKKDKYAVIDRVYPIDMTHVTLALEEILFGSKIFNKQNKEEVLNTAVHEAGHAVAIVRNKNCILHHASIIPRAKSAGRNYLTHFDESEFLTVDDYKAYIVIDLCGGVAEQIFGFNKRWYVEQNYKVEKDETSYSWPNMAEDFDDFIKRPSIKLDMKAARQSAISLLEYQAHFASFSRNLHDDDFDIEHEIRTIIEECYYQAVGLIQAHKSEIEKIAQLLIRKDIVLGDEMYAVSGIDRPLYQFEVNNR